MRVKKDVIIITVPFEKANEVNEVVKGNVI
jgi:predicted dinucleotide-binding enzyme